MNKPMTKQEKQAAYDAWYIAEVDKGIADLDAGRFLTHEEAEREMDALMDKLFKKYAKAA